MPAERNEDEAAIRQLLHEYAEAICEKDAEAAHAHYADDLVSFDLAPPLSFEGPDALDPRAMQAWLDTWKGQIGAEKRDLRIVVGGDVAFAHALRRMRGAKRDGQEVDLWFRATCCLRKEKSTWKIVHLHNSVPFYMDGSVRAAVDLHP